jgi:hypothetical protein
MEAFMVDQSSRSRSLLKPVVGGLVLIAAIIAVIYFRSQVWSGLKWTGNELSHWLTNWVPNNKGATVAIVGFGVVAFAINWIAHVRGRLRAWIFALVVEAGLWLLFWYSVLIPSLNDLVGLHIARPTPNAVVLAGAITMAIAGVIFWFLEIREEWNKYRHRTNPDD